MKYKLEKVNNVQVIELQGSLEGGWETFQLKDEITSQLEKGEKELAVGFIYSDQSFDGGGDLTQINVEFGIGFMLNDHHEVGGAVGYISIDEDDFDTFDSGTVTGFYHYNFSAGSNMNP